ncbi:MAG TPA: SGNH/GDSL hydrolase family protein [Polyangiaceae bacterium]|nr:SGNH/GDSL hydrolase family protein [Polyangiaceae bacterium]
MLSKARRRAIVLLAALAWALSCTRESTDPTGGETHFLTRCVPGESTCGDRLTCVCGVCTRLCAERATCETLPAAQCVPGCVTHDVQAPGVCEVSCVVDGDCAVVSRSHRCEQGVCRAGTVASGGAAGTGSAVDAGPLAESGAGGASDGGAGGAANVCDRGTVSANQVLVVGDSFFATTHQITAYLESLARGAGAVSIGERYRDRSTLMSSNALALGGNGIEDQYTGGAAEAEVKVVIMNGGGADVLLGSCDSANASCAVIAAAEAAAQALFAKMAADNVEHVVYAFYPDPKDLNVKARMDALRPLIQTACDSAPLPCHFLDLRDVFTGHYGEYLQTDQLNPSDAGAQATAEAIWATMQQYCIAQ